MVVSTDLGEDEGISPMLGGEVFAGREKGRQECERGRVGERGRERRGESKRGEIGGERERGGGRGRRERERH